MVYQDSNWLERAREAGVERPAATGCTAPTTPEAYCGTPTGTASDQDRMTHMKPMLNPKRDLNGATPEKLARALLRPLRPRPRTKAVVCNQVPVQEVAADQSGNRVLHLRKRP